MSELLRMEGISKQFAGVSALKNVHFDLHAGEVHALMGENGAGKSTLIKVLSGVYRPTAGDIYINGQKVALTSASDALKAGVGTIYQEFNLVPSLSIAENIFLGKELKKGGRLDRQRMIERSNELMKQMGFEKTNSAQRVSTLSVAQQQMVEILKSLFNNSKILVLDEPTAVLTERESERLFEMIRTLRERGVGIIYISHRLEEVLSLADRITVLRDGEYVGTLDNSQGAVTKEQLVSMMVGRTLSAYYPKRTPLLGKTVLKVCKLCKKGVYQDISFELHKGEILGITGLVGAGRTEVVKSLFGALSYDSGELFLDGEPIQVRTPRQAMDRGIAFIPENRKAEGLVLDASIQDNMMMASESQVCTHGVLNRKKIREFVRHSFASLDIRPAEPLKIARNFSGGNQQKAIIAKWIAINPKILILDEPTRGIDINAKAEIYKLMNRLVEEGMSIVMVSSEMPEIIGMCDRVLVMAEGRITGEFERKDFSQERIMAAASNVAV